MTEQHDVTLQRLDVFHQNGGHSVFYDSKHFAPTADKWVGVPVIFTDAGPSGTVQHPEFADVTAGRLPAKYRVVGRVSSAYLTNTGEKALRGSIEFTDPTLAAMANAGKLSLSTGFSSPETPINNVPGATRISGTVIPNHVLVIARGTCPNCYPNDAGAMFHNLAPPGVPEEEMADYLAVCDMAREFEAKTGIRIATGIDEGTRLMNLPGVKAALQGAAVRMVQRMNNVPVPPPTSEVDRLADEYLAIEAIKAMGPETRAREAFERDSAKFAEKYGIKVV